MSPSRRRVETFRCPHCGVQVPVDAASCRECGSDDETGWSTAADTYEAEIYGGYGDDDFDYEEYTSREFPELRSRPRRERFKSWAIRAILLLICIAILMQMF